MGTPKGWKPKIIGQKTCWCGNTFDVPQNNPRKKYCTYQCGRKKHHIDNREEELQRMKEWYQQNRESEIEKNRQYRKENKELFDWYHNKERFGGMRDIILERDGHKCRACGAKYGETKISIHHKDGTGDHDKTKGIEVNNDINNLITLCISCHHKLHHWQRRNDKVLLQDEDIVRTLRQLREAGSKSQR